MHAVAGDLLEEERRVDALADEAAVEIRDRRHDGVDAPGLDLAGEVGEIEPAGLACGAHVPGAESSSGSTGRNSESCGGSASASDRNRVVVREAGVADAVLQMRSAEPRRPSSER